MTNADKIIACPHCCETINLGRPSEANTSATDERRTAFAGAHGSATPGGLPVVRCERCGRFTRLEDCTPDDNLKLHCPPCCDAAFEEWITPLMVGGPESPNVGTERA